MTMESNRDKKFYSKDRPFSKDNNREKTGYSRPEKDFSGPERSERSERPHFDRQDSNKPHNEFYNVKTKRVLRPRKKNMAKVAETTNDGTMRLNRYIANSGICSRREADEYIRAGLVMINGKVVSEMGVKVQPGDEVSFNNERISPERKVYILINKPKDFVTTLEDPNAKKTVMDLLRGACKERVYPVGRLDRMTTGVLLLTNDGELAKKLTHPKYEKKKIYHVVLDKNLRKNDMEMIAEGLDLEDGIVRVDAISYVRDTKNEIGIEIHSGRNRVIRRIFEKMNYRVKKLDRVFFAGLTKKGLTRGQWRFLTDREIGMLKMGAYE
jgi:23S rRNA pseudouridine2605 synthase